MMTDIVKNNEAIHDCISGKYEKMHVEIFNPIEQGRIRQCIMRAVSFLKTLSNQRNALDYGCGSGNITRHLIDSGFHVVSADISEGFLNNIRGRFGSSGLSETLKINGYDLANIEDNYFDLTVAYSVLHHIPDYLRLVTELIRVTKPGGIIYLDHEQNESFWSKEPKYKEFLRAAKAKTKFDLAQSLNKYLNLSNYYHGIRRLITPRYQAEGDIHVWPDDHIEWDKIKQLMEKDVCEVLLKEDYLLYRNYPQDVYEEYKNLCSDYWMALARKKYSRLKGLIH